MKLLKNNFFLVLIFSIFFIGCSDSSKDSSSSKPILQGLQVLNNKPQEVPDSLKEDEDKMDEEKKIDEKILEVEKNGSETEAFLPDNISEILAEKIMQERSSNKDCLWLKSEPYKAESSNSYGPSFIGLVASLNNIEEGKFEDGYLPVAYYVTSLNEFNKNNFLFIENLKIENSEKGDLGVFNIVLYACLTEDEIKNNADPFMTVNFNYDLKKGGYIFGNPIKYRGKVFLYNYLEKMKDEGNYEVDGFKVKLYKAEISEKITQKDSWYDGGEIRTINFPVKVGPSYNVYIKDEPLSYKEKKEIYALFKTYTMSDIEL